jgi:hypothetical protein
MKKILRTLIFGIVLAFFLAITIPLVVAQDAPFPQPIPPASQPASGPVVLEGETLLGFFAQPLILAETTD